MALVLMEGFDHVNSTTQLALKGWTLVNSATLGVAGRINGNCARFTNANSSNALVKSLPSTYSTVIVGFAFRNSSTPTADHLQLRLRTSGGATVAEAYVTSTGVLRVKNSGGTTIATGTTAIVANTWNYVELKLVVNGASGSCEVKLNGQAEIASTTGNFGSTNVGDVYLNRNQTQVAGNVEYDDIYVCDTSGSLNNNFLGDFHVQTLYPTADGNYSQWTPSSGSNHYDRVNETAPDGDTTYVSDATVGHRDSYVYGDLTPLTGSVFGVQTVMYARKDDAGTRQIAAMVRRSGSDYDGSTVTLTTSYTYYSEIRETDPSTSAAWTISGVNAAEFGVKTVA